MSTAPARKTKVHVDSLQDMGKRFVNAWKRAEKGEADSKANPPHPAEILVDVLAALGLSVTQAAQQLGVSRAALSRVLHSRSSISPELALRLEAWLGKDRGGDARHWLRMQLEYDVSKIEQQIKDKPLNVQPAPRLRSAA